MSVPHAREAAERGGWEEAYDLLMKADADGLLGPADLPLLGEVAFGRQARVSFRAALILASLAGTAAMVLLAGRLMPDRGSVDDAIGDEVREFSVTMMVREDGPLDGVSRPAGLTLFREHQTHAEHVAAGLK